MTLFIIIIIMGFMWFFRQWPVGTIVVLLIGGLGSFLSENAYTGRALDKIGIHTRRTIEVKAGSIEWRSEKFYPDYRVLELHIRNPTDLYISRLEFDCGNGHFYDGTGMMPFSESTRKYRVHNSTSYIRDCSVGYRTGKPKSDHWEDRVE